MATELFVDTPHQAVTLNGAIATAPAAGTVETWPVTIAAITGTLFALPSLAAGQMRMATDTTEIILVTAGVTTAGNQSWTVTRGADGTTPTTHASGAVLSAVATAASEQAEAQLGSTNIFTGPQIVTTPTTAPAPSTVPLPVTPANGGAIDAGAHSYGITNIDTNGNESPPSPLTTQTFNASLGTPAAPTVALSTGGTLASGTALKYRVRFQNSAGGYSLAGTASASVTPTGATLTVLVTAIPVGPVGTAARLIERSADGGTTWTQVARLTSNAAGNSSVVIDSGLATGATLSVSDTSAMQTVSFGVLPLGPSGTAKRRIVRSKTNTTAPLYSITTINDNTSVALTGGNNTAGITTDTIADSAVSSVIAPSQSISSQQSATSNLLNTGMLNGYPQVPWVHLPANGIDPLAGWKQARNNSPTTPCWITFYGASDMGSVNASDVYTKGIPAQIKAALIAGGYPLYADYFETIQRPSVQPSSAALFSDVLNSLTTVESCGYGYTRAESVTTATSGGSLWHMTFTLPYTCAGGIDIIYLDYGPTVGATWKYQVGAGAIQTVTATGDGSSQTAKIYKLHIAGSLAAGTVVQWGRQSAGSTCWVLGIACYAASTGIGYGNLADSLGWGPSILSPWNSSVIGLFQVPWDRCALMAGIADQTLAGSPQVSFPYFGAPTQAPAIFSQANTGGSIPIGSYIYRTTNFSNGGYSAPSPASATATITTTNTGKVVLTVPVDGWGSYPNATASVTALRAIWRSADAGSTWRFIGSINDNTTTVFNDTFATGTLSALPTGPGTVQPTIGAFGFPTAPQCLIIECAADDCIPGHDNTQLGLKNQTLQAIWSGAAQSFPDQRQWQGSLERLIEACRAANPACAIILLGTSNTDCLSDARFTSSVPLQNIAPGMVAGAAITNASQLFGWVKTLADQFNCVLVDMGLKWKPTPVASGYISGSDMHPNDVGYADIASTISSLLLSA